MSDLLWPGDARSGDLCTDATILTAMLRVESAWLDSRHPDPPTPKAATNPHTTLTETNRFVSPTASTSAETSRSVSPATPAAPNFAETSRGVSPITPAAPASSETNRFVTPAVPGSDETNRFVTQPTPRPDETNRFVTQPTPRPDETNRFVSPGAGEAAGSGAPGVESAAAGLLALVGPEDLPGLAVAAEEGGNPVIPLLALLRERLGDDPRAGQLHQGLTSQDVLDTALAICLREAAARIRGDLAAQIGFLAALADRHRRTDMAGRTLTQHAVPITFGLKVAGWLQATLDARDLLEAAADLPVQIGGAAGSLAAVVAIEGSPERAVARVAATAALLGLPVRPPWHTSRGVFTRFGDALVTCTDAWGRIANDVLTLGRPEIGELSLATSGGSSAMPNKKNPTLAVLVRRAALAGPPLAATLHMAAASMVDERADGAWHVEWDTLRTLTRRTVAAGSQITDLLAGLRVDEQRMAATLAAARPGIDAEQRKYARVEGPYRGATDEIIDAALARAGE
ncbi:lyase family protein [Actinoplanes sp. TRM 88003]|uniref:Lyase family protein n=1 Tax=Paractinoplanes aksuensis TaxID=2939490 RepID=A0ABT1E4B9_9ACTN|nr:lyase family protein [Actinoplanes aksuensis]MCO8277964.1 lyase family protein [Actinoplanes aksuensis]